MLPRPVKEAENRLAHLQEEKSAILADVERRVVESKLAAARGATAASPEKGLEYVLNDVAFQEIRRLERGLATRGERKRLGDWKELARRLGAMTETDKRRRLDELVREMTGDVCGHFDPRVYRFATNLLPTLLSSLLSPRSLTSNIDLAQRITIDGPLDQIRACADRGTLVVTPTHSSNMDSVVIGWSLYRAGLPPCTYGAGKNLFSNRFISFFMHNLGAYRVDRRIQHGLYKDVLKTYSQVLLERGYHSLFFPGGTRSRSGAVERKLKLGLLSTTVGAYQRSLSAGTATPARRIYVVPATINYAITLEAETLIDDFLAEEGKGRYIIEDDEFSRLSRLYEFSKRVLAMEGSVVIRYGTPLDPFGNEVDADGESMDPRGRRVDPATYVTGADGKVEPDAQRDAEYTRNLADEIIHGFQRLTVFMPTNLVARAIFDRLAAERGTRDVYRLLRVATAATPIAQVRDDVARMRNALRDHPNLGGLPERYQSMRPGDLIDDALRMFRGYHSRPVVERIGEELAVRDLTLLFYYQNRTAHVVWP